MINCGVISTNCGTSMTIDGGISVSTTATVYFIVNVARSCCMY